MRKLYGIVLLFAVLLSCNSKEEKPVVGYLIKGTLNNINATKAYLYTANHTLIDSSAIVLNSFKFSGSVTSVEMSTITFKNSAIEIPFWLDNSELFVYASPNTQTIYGGEIQNEFNIYSEKIQSLEHSKLALTQQFMNDKSYTKEVFIGAIDSIKTIEFNYLLGSIQKANHTPISNYFIDYLLKDKTLTVDQLTEMETIVAAKTNLKGLEAIKSQKDTLIALALKEQLLLASTAKKLAVKREKAILFVGESLNGKDLGLATILKGKKAVLIDFWASWCGPCRQVTPQVRALYQKYKSKGFDIVTVSEDKSQSAWRNGIAEDKMLAWHHIYDDQMRIANMFQVNAIPHMVLLDGEGGIIGSKITIFSLEKELKQIFN